jgi:hypothetical protein
MNRKRKQPMQPCMWDDHAPWLLVAERLGRPPCLDTTPYGEHLVPSQAHFSLYNYIQEAT